ATTVELLHTAATSYPTDKARNRGLVELRLSSLLLTQGDPDEAVTVATGTLEGIGSVHSQRITDLLTDLQQQTTDPRHHSITGIAPLHQHLTDTLTTSPRNKPTAPRHH
ncbi:MAG: hypothetical protein ACRDTC_01360, partial [Pseudonocardiaceae bacterium]